MQVFIQLLRCLRTNIQHVFQAYITANQKLSYPKLVAGYLYEVQLYGTTLLLIQRKNLNLALFLNQK